MPNEFPPNEQSAATRLPTQEELDALDNIQVTDEEVEEFLTGEGVNLEFPSTVSLDQRKVIIRDMVKDRKVGQMERELFYQDPRDPSDARKKLREFYNPMIYINPDESASVEPVDDSITEDAQKIMAVALAAKPAGVQKGVHRCSEKCAAQSSSFDYFVGGEMVHTLLVHYVRYHREKCSPQLLDWITETAREIQAESDPIPFQFEWAQARYRKGLASGVTTLETLEASIKETTAKVLRGE